MNEMKFFFRTIKYQTVQKYIAGSGAGSVLLKYGTRIRSRIRIRIKMIRLRNTAMRGPLGQCQPLAGRSTMHTVPEGKKHALKGPAKHKFCSFPCSHEFKGVETFKLHGTGTKLSYLNSRKAC